MPRRSDGGCALRHDVDVGGFPTAGVSSLRLGSAADDALQRLAQGDPVCQRLMTVPGVVNGTGTGLAGVAPFTHR